MTGYGKWALRAAMAGAATLAVVAALAPPSTGSAKAATTWTIFQRNTWAGDDSIEDVTVAPSGSTWGAGYGSGGPVVQHWVNGSFRTVPLPSTWRGRFQAIDASRSDNVWAFGQDTEAPYAAQWNGTRWTRHAMPEPFSASDAEAFSPTNVWAVSGNGQAQRWNGSSWRFANAPIKTTAIDGGADAQMWAVGHHPGADGRPQPAAARWDGSKWTEVSPPELELPGGESEAIFTDVTMVSTTNVWAVGTLSTVSGDEPGVAKPILAHYVGGKWHVWTSGAGVGYSRVVQDGQGGIHILQGSWNPSVLHGRNGVWTRTTLPRTSGYEAAAFTLERNPVTDTLWISGFQAPEGDPDDPTVNGTYWRRLAG
ncbi:MAG: hypothetical protein GEV11_00845 [Streptosporangiales bacterium]|nr:hypothetical protein [Streptosporangiales bacterium]